MEFHGIPPGCHIIPLKCHGNSTETIETRQSEMADLARRATRDLSQFHMGGANFDTVRSWKL